MKDFTHFANVEFTISKTGSRFIPYESIDVEFEATPHAGDLDLFEYFDFVHHRMIALPDNVEAMTDDQEAHIKAEFWGRFFSYETDYGTEHDCEFEFRNESVVIRLIPVSPQ